MGTSERDIKKYLKVGDNFENVRQLQNYLLLFRKEIIFLWKRPTVEIIQKIRVT